jgi:hypothetical protein
MDIYCPTCGEPWEMESLHEEAQERYGIPYYETPDVRGYDYGNPSFTKIKNDEYNSDDYHKIYEQVSTEFRAKGCRALNHISTATWCEPQERDGEDLTMAEAASAMYDILGDDMDGAAAMLEDFGMGY